MLTALKHAAARANNFHRPRGEKDVFIFSTPRGGSTWLSELILTQPGFKPSDEPFNLRDAPIARELAARGIHTWEDLYANDKRGGMEDHIEAIASGRSGVTNPFFYRNHFRVLTHRVCFKILHAAENRIPWIRARFSGAVVLLLRHPAPVALSRKVLPRLTTFLESDFREGFTAEQLSYAERVVRDGAPLDKAVLDWCFQTAPALATAEPEWIVATYEQLVLEPAPLVDRLAERFDLPRRESMRARLRVPSASTHQSDPTTQGVLEQRRGEEGAGGGAQRWLVDKWRKNVEPDALARAMEALDVFGIDAYRSDDALPSPRYWLKATGTAP